MRAYFFGNMYLSSIQQGIQAAHVTHELFLKYDPMAGLEGEEYLFEWAADHKTMILLNGGYAENLQRLYDMFDSKLLGFPFAKFHEEEASLNGALTCVGIVLPERIYETAAELRKNPTLLDAIQIAGQWTTDGKTFDISAAELGLCLALNDYGLAS